MKLSCKSCDRAIEGAALACVACGALHHEGCHRGSGHCAACACAKAAIPVSVGGREVARSAVLLAAGLAMLALTGAVMVQGAARGPDSTSCSYRQPVAIQAPARAAPVLVSARARATNVAGHFRGTISGNDPRVTADLALTQDGLAVTGVLLWDSPNSGHNERRVAGNLDPERGLLMLRDVEMPVAKANGAWHFCAVDYYLLDVTGDDLSGTYWSSACTDRARMRLHRVP